MAKKIWFKAKMYGWGWYPVTWQGWLILVAYVVLVTRDFLATDKFSHSVSDTLFGWSPRFILATAILISICYVRGEKPRWRWGK